MSHDLLREVLASVPKPDTSSFREGQRFFDTPLVAHIPACRQIQKELSKIPKWLKYRLQERSRSSKSVPSSRSSQAPQAPEDCDSLGGDSQADEDAAPDTPSSSTAHAGSSFKYFTQLAHDLFNFASAPSSSSSSSFSHFPQNPAQTNFSEHAFMGHPPFAAQLADYSQLMQSAPNAIRFVRPASVSAPVQICPCESRKGLRCGRRQTSLLVGLGDLLLFPSAQFEQFLSDRGLLDDPQKHEDFILYLRNCFTFMQRRLREIEYRDPQAFQKLNLPPSDICENSDDCSLFRSALLASPLSAAGILYLSGERDRKLSKSQKQKSRRKIRKEEEEGSGPQDMIPLLPEGALVPSKLAGRKPFDEPAPARRSSLYSSQFSTSSIGTPVPESDVDNESPHMDFQAGPRQHPPEKTQQFAEKSSTIPAVTFTFAARSQSNLQSPTVPLTPAVPATLSSSSSSFFPAPLIQPFIPKPIPIPASIQGSELAHMNSSRYQPFVNVAPPPLPFHQLNRPPLPPPTSAFFGSSVDNTLTGNNLSSTSLQKTPGLLDESESDVSKPVIWGHPSPVVAPFARDNFLQGSSNLSSRPHEVSKSLVETRSPPRPTYPVPIYNNTFGGPPSLPPQMMLPPSFGIPTPQLQYPMPGLFPGLPPLGETPAPVFGSPFLPTFPLAAHPHMANIQPVSFNPFPPGLPLNAPFQFPSMQMQPAPVGLQTGFPPPFLSFPLVSPVPSSTPIAVSTSSLSHSIS